MKCPKCGVALDEPKVGKGVEVAMRLCPSCGCTIDRNGSISHDPSPGPTVHWCGPDGDPLCGSDSDEMTRIRDYYGDRFCKECGRMLDARQ